MPTWTERTVPANFWRNYREPAFLLLETGDFLLQETGDKILLDGFGPVTATWTERTIPS